MHEMEHLLDPTFHVPPTSTPEEQLFQRRATASCRQMITVRISTNINNISPPTIYGDPPGNIVSIITELLQGATTTDHVILEQEAKAITLKEGSTIQSFEQEHRAHRARMLSAGFPNITEEECIVRFMLKGLRSNSQFAPLVIQIKSEGTPKTITDLHRRLQDIEYESGQTTTNVLLPQSALGHTPSRRNARGYDRNGDRDRTGDRDRNRFRTRGNKYRRSNGERWTNPNQGQFIDISQLGQLAHISRALDSLRAPPGEARRGNPQNCGGQRRAHARRAHSEPNHHDPIDIVALQALGLALAESSAQHDSPEPSASKNENGRFTLDSGSHPSHVNHRTSGMIRLKAPLSCTDHTASQKPIPTTPNPNISKP